VFGHCAGRDDEQRELLARGVFEGKSAAFVTLEDAGLLWEGLAMAFGYPNSIPVSSDGNGLRAGGARL
jgi:hypothetical protein